MDTPQHSSGRPRPSDALEAHRAELCQLVARYGLLHPRVFGSAATRSDDEESGIDLLVDPGEGTGLLAISGLKIDAEKLLGVPVSVLTPNSLPPKFRADVLSQARVL